MLNGARGAMISEAAGELSGPVRGGKAEQRASDLAPVIGELQSAITSLSGIAESFRNRGIPTAAVATRGWRNKCRGSWRGGSLLGSPRQAPFLLRRAAHLRKIALDPTPRHASDEPRKALWRLGNRRLSIG